MNGPYRRSDELYWLVAEAKRIRDALVAVPTFHNIGKIRSSKEIEDVLTACILELSK